MQNNQGYFIKKNQGRAILNRVICYKVICMIIPGEKTKLLKYNKRILIKNLTLPNIFLILKQDYVKKFPKNASAEFVFKSI